VQALRDAMSQIKAKNAIVFGVSTDTVESHKGFHDKEHLNFDLLADPDHKMVEAYGALMPNGKMAQRFTFIIGPTGTIQSIDRNVNGQFERGEKLTTRHAENVALLLSDWKVKPGGPVPLFSVTDTDGKTVELLPTGKKAAVVLFLSTKCPASVAYDDRLKNLAADPAFKEVAFLALYSNADESVATVKSRAVKQNYPFAVAKDEKAALANHFDAQKTPTVWVINTKGTVVYRGAIDDNVKADKARTNYLKDALDAVLAGRPIPAAETPVNGCAIKRK
jgi:peroxiredoxin